jgi:hypothetical protein
VFRLVFRRGWSLPRGGNGTNRGRRLQGTPMQVRYLLDVFPCHTADACIRGMSSQGHMGLLEPIVQGLGMNPQQARAISNRKSSHDHDSFRGKSTWGTDASRLPGKVLELPDFHEIS